MNDYLLTADMVLGHADLPGTENRAHEFSKMIFGRIASPHRTGHLAMLARIVAAQNKGAFNYLEVGILHGGNMAFLQHIAGEGVYCGVDIFNFTGKAFDDTSGKPIGIGHADRNIRYFGAGYKYAIFEADSQDPATREQVSLFMPKPTMIFLDADHEYNSLARDMDIWKDMLSPGGVLAVDDYRNPRCPGVKKYMDEMNKDGWNDIGALPDGEAVYVLQKL